MNLKVLCCGALGCPSLAQRDDLVHGLHELPLEALLELAQQLEELQELDDEPVVRGVREHVEEVRREREVVLRVLPRELQERVHLDGR